MRDGLKPIYGRVPVITNAHHNRAQTVRLWEAGYTAAEIAEAFPLVWKLSDEGKIGQRYDSYFVELGDLKEIGVMMASEVVDMMIADRAHKPKPPPCPECGVNELEYADDDMCGWCYERLSQD